MYRLRDELEEYVKNYRGYSLKIFLNVNCLDYRFNDKVIRGLETLIAGKETLDAYTLMEIDNIEIWNYNNKGGLR